MDDIRRIIDDMKINFMRQIENLKSSGKPSTSSGPALTTGNSNEDIGRLVSEVQRLRHMMDEKFNNLMNLID